MTITTVDTRELASELRDLEFLDDDELDQDDLERMAELRELAEEITEFYNGETLIHEDYWQQYAQELAQDLGYIDGEEKWPLNCIDWEKAASELEHDYFTVTFDGDTYFVRAY